ALGVPVVTIFGPTFPEWTEIDFPHERKVSVKVFCGPCQRKTCPLDHRCMTRVTPGMVFAASMQLLPATPPRPPAQSAGAGPAVIA
ncbi:MAG: heptosyltransferase, partial [Humisphaera sp.]|nr:heptosyltransferase [Humisphaera sp.]